jgi:hypothetical protein
VKDTMLATVGAVCLLVGAVWFLQGVGVIGGSFMTDSTLWLVIGLVVALVGVALLGLWVRGRVRRT